VGFEECLVLRRSELFPWLNSGDCASSLEHIHKMTFEDTGDDMHHVRKDIPHEVEEWKEPKRGPLFDSSLLSRGVFLVDFPRPGTRLSQFPHMDLISLAVRHERIMITRGLWYVYRRTVYEKEVGIS